MSTTDSLDRLIDEVLAATASERNQDRIHSPVTPRLGIGYENPIAWVRLFGVDPVRYFSDPQYHLEQQLRQMLWAFRHIEDDTPISPTVGAWLGHYPEYTFFGMTLGVKAHGGPELQTDHPMTRDPDLALLPPVDFRTSGWMPRMLEWYERLLELADGRLSIPFFAWNRGCLDLAVQLRGYENLLLDTFERPQFVHDLLKVLVRERCRWFDAAAQYLNQPLGPTFVADDWVSVPYISPSMFRDFILPRYLDIEAHHGVLAGFHSCGDQTPLHPYMLQIKTLNVFEVSPWMTVGTALDSLPADKELNIAVHPNDVVVDAPAEMARKHRARAAALQGTGRRFSLRTSGLTPLHGEADFIARANTWVRLAREAFA